MISTIRTLSSSTLIGDEVRNPSGEDLGRLEEIMIDVNDGHIAYAVISFGGFLGLGDKLFAVPWEALTIDTDGHALVLDVDRETLESAPGFDKDNWPKTSNGDIAWLAGVYEYYGYPPYWHDARLR